MYKRLFMFCFFCVCCVVGPRGANAAEMATIEQMRELKQMVQELKLMVETQQREIAQLKAARETAVVQTVPIQPASAVPPSRQLLGRWNPDIGVIADTVLLLDSPKEDEEGADRINVREFEIIFGSAVDPYSRLDATLAISDFEEMELEEAYLTRFGLPWGVKGRVGRFLPKIGKAIPVHRDSLDTVDEPLVIQRYFGHHGYNKTGADVSRILDLPWPVVHELTAGVLEGGNGEGGTLFGDARRRPTVYSHLKNYLDIDDVTNIEVGLSHMAGSRDEDANFEVQVLALDGTFLHHFGSERRLKLQGEVFHTNRQDSLELLRQEDPDTGEIFFTDEDLDGNTYGLYLLADVRLHKQWAVGFRYDYVELISGAEEHPHHEGEEEEEEHESLEDFDKADRAYTAYLTFYQSEFARWRAQFTRVDLAHGEADNQVMIQGTFAIGEHKHKIQ
jgi:hypothetical protein